MTDVTPIFKPANYGTCECGCGVEGPYKKAWKSNGQRCVKLKCRCRRCTGGRSNRGGKKKQAIVARAFGLVEGRFAASHEEQWGGYFANEVKSGKQVGPVANWWARVEKQVLANESDFGSLRRPVRAVAMPEGWGDDGLVVVRLSTWRDHIDPALNEFYGSAS